MVFGTADRRKADVAAGVALAVGRIAGLRGKRLGVVTFREESPKTIPPRHGARGTFGLFEVLRHDLEERGFHDSSLDGALVRTGRLARSRAAVFVVSDFREPCSYRGSLAQLAGRHHVTAVEIRDPREQELVDVGDLWLVDPETGRQLRVDTSSRRLRERFAERAADERQELASGLRSARAEHVVLSTSGDWLRALADFLRRQGGRR